MGEVVYFRDKEKIIKELSDKVVNFLTYISLKLGCRNEIEYFEIQEFLEYYYSLYESNYNIKQLFKDFEEVFDIEEFEVLDKKICIFRISNLEEILGAIVDEKNSDEDIGTFTFLDKLDIKKESVVEELMLMTDEFSIDLYEKYGISVDVDENLLRNCLIGYYKLYSEFNQQVLIGDFVDGLSMLKEFVDKDFSFNTFTIENMMLDRYNLSDKERFVNKSDKTNIINFRRRKGDDSNGDNNK